jgi:hypothetical protein
MNGMIVQFMMSLILIMVVNKMAKLSDFSNQELEEELSRREHRANVMPYPLTSINLDPVLKQIKIDLEFICDNGHKPKDMQQFIYEAIMKAAYGPHIFEWILEYTTK